MKTNVANLETWKDQGASFWLLAHESRDLSQAETKLIVVTNWANYFFSAKMVRFEKKMSFWVKIVNILWGCLGFNKILFSARDESGDLWANGEKITQI